MTKPISPDDIVEAKLATIPDAVIELFNTEIARKWNGHSATIIKNDMLSKITGRLDLTENQVYESGYLNIEGIYRAEGWKVEYDKPGYNESYDAFYKFTKGK